MPLRGHRLIAFDAFGTLFSPRYPIAHQYAAVTRSFLSQKLDVINLDNLNQDRIQNLFLKGVADFLSLL
jgi:hypothetical protein